MKGFHGYDPELPSMHTVMFTRGPAFKGCNGHVPPVEASLINQVDIYPLLAHLLQIQPEKNDGSVKKVKYLLKNPHSIEDFTNAASFDNFRTLRQFFIIYIASGIIYLTK